MNYKTEDTLHKIYMVIWKHSESSKTADIAIAPLTWYISTGRCSGTWEKAFQKLTKRQITTVANRLLKAGGGDYAESVTAVREYISHG